MRVITNLIRKLKGFEKSIPDILREGIEENQEIILDYNTEAQLYEEGITRDNVSIASYAPPAKDKHLS